MKYIRTTDGRIFEIEKYLGRYGISKVIAICDFDGNFIDIEKQNTILKQADTIEELCDEFLIVLGNGTHRFIRSLSGKGKGGITWYRQRNYKIVAIYGAIWTDKGLIYVAKMNDEGELELL